MSLEKALAHWRKNPVEAVKDWFNVTPEPYQADIINSLLGPSGISRVAVKSGHGVGKTTTEAWCIWVYLMTRAHCRIPCTAPTAAQLSDILWPEVAKWASRMPREMYNMWDISATHVRNKAHPKTWFAVSRTSNKQENMQGFHNDYIMVVCEEASGIPQNIYEVIEGILSNAEHENQEAKLLLVGNPTQTAGEFYNAFHKSKHLYTRFTVSGDTLPPDDKNGGTLYTSNRVSQAYRDTMAKKYGRDSAVYDVRVRGLFPAEADNAVVPLAWAEAAQFVDRPVFDPVGDPTRLVMDVARFGGDETVLGYFRGGHCIKMQAWPKTSTMECVDILYEAYKNTRNVSQIVVDEPGVGGGVIDAARRAGLPITPYHGGASLKKDLDRDEDVRMFANRRSRDWWVVRRAFEKGICSIPHDEVLVDQLASVRYDYYNEKIKVETKKELRDRLGDDASPDRADVIVMGLAPFTSMEGSVPAELLELAGQIEYGEDRATANMDF